MKRLTFLAIVINLLLFTACANQPRSADEADHAQLSAISLWHQCVDNSLQILGSPAAAPEKLKHNPDDTIQKTLIACEGYRQDVLDTFPERLQGSLDRLMVQQTYESGYTKYAERHGMILPISAVTFDKLRRKRFLAEH